MMSIATLSSTGAASSYYEIDDYYTQENAQEHTQLSQWHGKGAELQGLSGPVKPEDFRNVLDGKTPDGGAIGRIVAGERQHRPGIDLTFTPPKSVAIMAQVFGDKRIIEAHKEAVKETLSMIEEHAAQTRVGQNGVMKAVNTNNLTIATFFHTSTRAQDCGFHTHSVIANMTMGDDGKWRSVHNDTIWENSKAKFGENYSMRLAEKLGNELGYEIVAKGKNAEYEIAGVPKELIDHFSTRGRQITELLKERGIAGPKNREWANRQTREKKVPMDKQLEEAAWKERAKSLGIDLSHLVTQSYDKLNKLTPENKVTTAIEGVKDAVEHLAQRTSAFTVQDIVQTSRNFVIGKSNDADIKKAIDHLKENEYILTPDPNSKLVTTRQIVATENDNLMRVDFGRNSFKAIASEKKAMKVASEFKLNSGQKNSLVMAATSKDRVNSVQGWAGVGKSYYGRALNSLISERGYEAIGLSPSAQAANELEKGSGIKSNTLASFIFQHRDLMDDATIQKNKWESISRILSGKEKRKYLVIDESSFVSSKDFNSVLRIAEAMDARVLKIGDYKQLGAVDAGAPHKQLLDHNVTQENLDEIIRQKDNPVLREAVYAAIQDKPDVAMEKITVSENTACQKMYEDAKSNPDAKINREAMRRELAKQAADQYANLSPMQRATTALIVQNNDMRTQVNSLVRSALKEQGELGKEAITVESLKNTGLTDSQLKYAHNYQVGHVVRFNTPSQLMEIQANDYFRVTDNATMLGDERFITLVSASNPEKEIVVHPKELASRGERGIEVYESTERELSAGDRIRWTRNDKPRDIVNTQTAIIVSVNPDDKTAELVLENGEARTMAMGELKNNHLDYNFANTAHSTQGATVSSVITVVESWHKLLTNMKSFYVGISRAKDDVTLITDSQPKTIEMLQNNVERDDIALTLYQPGQQPLDFDMLDDLKGQLESGVSVRDLYIDLVAAFQGDRFAAQTHLQELGIDGSKIERDLVVENALKEFNDDRPSGDHHIETDKGETTGVDRHDFGLDNENHERSEISDKNTKEDIDWFTFDESSENDRAQEVGASDGLDEREHQKDIEQRRDIDMEL